MPLKLVRCGLCSDESREYIENMKNTEDGRKVILIVPDQYSYMAEKKMAEVFGGTGLNNKFVYTFRQMKRTFLKTNERSYLKTPGKNMLLKAVAEAVIDEDSIFYVSRKSPGFLENLNNLLSELKRYCITPKTLSEQAQRVENKLLRNKLITVASVYAEFEKRLKDGEFLDAEDDFSRLADEILKNEYFKDSSVWVDKFSDFSPQHMEVISAILKNGADMTVYLPAKCDGEVLSDSIFEFPEKTVAMLKKLCSREKAEYSEAVCRYERKMKPAIRVFAENYENPGFTYSENAEEIRIFEAKEKYSEVEAAALKICDLVREDKMKFSEISVVCGELDEYISFIEPIFFEYHIPYFADFEVLMTEHPVAVLISSLFEILDNGGFLKDACMKYLRTGFIIPDGDADRVENHIIRCGIRGNMWKNSKYWIEEKKVFEDVTGQKSKFSDNGYLDSLRKKITEPILRFEEATKGKRSVRQMCEALFCYLGDIELYEKISENIESLNRQGRENEALRFEQVWNFIVDICDQAVVSLGDEKITREEFFELLISGMSGCKISIIPPITDGVAVSDVSRGVTDEVGALFVLGATKTALPGMMSGEGLLLDDEREELTIEVAPTRQVSGVMSEFKAVSLLCTPSEFLNISYPVSDISGNISEPSQLVFELEEKIARLLRQDNLVERNDFLYISSPEATIHKLLLKMSDGKALNPLWEMVRKWYEKNGGYEEKLRIIDTAAAYKKAAAKLSSENAKALYEDYTNYSISRIEKYFQCPFGYFLNNGLKLREREPWQIGGTDTGDLLHWAVCEYCKTVDGNTLDLKVKKQNWESLTDDESQKIVSDVMARATERIEFSEYEGEKTKNILGRIEKALKKSVRIVNLSMKNGRYSGVGYELEFSEKEIKNADGSVKIKGVIDRVDIFEDEAAGKAYIRIIDYKSGAKGYSRERILNRVDLQLMVYAVAAADMYREKVFEGTSGELEPVVKGVFYDKINKNFVECNYETGTAAEDMWISQSKLDGKIFTAEIGKGTKAYFDTADAENMDFEIAQNGESRFMKLKKKQKGQGLDKRSDVESEAVGDAMLGYVKNSLIEAHNKIQSGDIEVSPYKRKSASDSACRYCPYSSICAPDIEKGVCRKRERPEKEIINEIMGGEE